MAQRWPDCIWTWPSWIAQTVLTILFAFGPIQPLRAAACVSETPWFNRCTVPRVDHLRKNVLGLRDSQSTAPSDVEIITGSIRPNRDMLKFPLPKERQPTPAVARPDIDQKDAAAPPRDRAPFQTAEEDIARSAETKTSPKLRPATGPSGVALNFVQAVRRTISDNPLVAASIAVTREAKAGIALARSPLLPALDINAATGQNVSGNYGTAVDQPYVDLTKAYGRWAAEGAVAGRQLLYDFDATKEQVKRAKFNWRATNAREIATVDEVTQNVASAYLKVLETRDLLQLTSDNVAAIQEILELLVESQRNGNATLADVARVKGRLVEAEALRADQDFAVKIANDRFRVLAPFPDYGHAVPRDRTKAVELMVRNNPRMLAAQETINAAEAEIRSLQGQNKPRIEAQVDATGRNYRGYRTNTQVETRAMVNLNYKLLDGGKNRAEEDAAYARLQQETMRYKDAKDNLELDLLQALWNFESARGKSLSLKDGLSDNREARRLYTEQFKGGKRTLLEFLEVQSAFFQSSLAVVNNEFEQRRAIVQILRVLGLLSKTVIPNG